MELQQYLQSRKPELVKNPAHEGFGINEEMASYEAASNNLLHGYSSGYMGDENLSMFVPNGYGLGSTYLNRYSSVPGNSEMEAAFMGAGVPYVEEPSSVMMSSPMFSPGPSHSSNNGTNYANNYGSGSGSSHSKPVKDGPIIIPPLNTNIAFSSRLPRFNPDQQQPAFHSSALMRKYPKHDRSDLPTSDQIFQVGFMQAAARKQARKQAMKEAMAKKNTIRENFEDAESVSTDVVNFSSSGLDDNEPQDLIIPPLNTNIAFSSVLPKYTAGLYQYGVGAHTHNGEDEHVHLPENFSWAISTKEDSDEMLSKKSLIASVFNQYSCGSCWKIYPRTLKTTTSIINYDRRTTPISYSAKAIPIG